MSKQNYTHMQELLPAITGDACDGKSRLDITEHFGRKDKSLVKGIVKMGTMYF